MICHGLMLPKENHSKYHRRIQVLLNERTTLLDPLRPKSYRLPRSFHVFRRPLADELLSRWRLDSMGYDPPPWEHESGR